jgi:serine phosphatase RsbU (regulator of sigma subunit)
MEKSRASRAEPGAVVSAPGRDEPLSNGNPQTLPTLTRTLPPRRFLLVWALAWALVGLLVAAAIVFTTDVDSGPILRLSLLFAEVVGLTALVSARLVFPLFDKLPRLLSIFLQVLTLLSGTVFGSVAVLLFEPLFTVAQIRNVALVVGVNAVIAVIVGLAVYTYDTMRLEIERTYDALRQKEALDRELSIARDVQQLLLPRSAPHVTGLELDGVCLPAVEVGGDYFDFLPLDEERVGLAVADVSGKGVPASLLMAGLQASVRGLSLQSLRPAELTCRLNEILYRSSSAARYATFFFGLYDGRERTFHYCNAGHHPPLVIGEGGVRRLDHGGGLPIGMFCPGSYAEGSMVLARGDLLALYTDGVVEAPDGNGREFGEERLAELLRARRGEPLDRIRREVLDELRRWTGGAEAHDDVTLVLARAR